MIRILENCFLLDTCHTSYCFRRMETGHLEHLYYGAHIDLDSAAEAEALAERHAFAPGNSIIYDNRHPGFSLEDIRLEMSSHGKGDLREPFVEVIHADGSMTSDFLYESASVAPGAAAFEALPSSYGAEGEAETLTVTLRDRAYHLTLELRYTVYEEKDVITHSARLTNSGTESVRLTRLMSTQLDFETDDLILTNFTGAWAREMEKREVPLRAGKFISASCCGASSNRANPFVMLSKAETSEDAGPCWGLNLVYSGNHYECAEVSPYHKTRFVSGIRPEGFEFRVGEGESFEAPEAVMTFSDAGFNGMSRTMHRFVRENIVRGLWKNRERPVLLNSWEAAYFNIDEGKLLRLARAGKDVGIELFVMDDGWFGERRDDTSSLGDWTPNPKKLPGGLAGIADKVNALGLSFGIWIEPEMVNENSALYRAHPDWVMQIPGHAHSEGRNQRILDLANPAVVAYMADTIASLLGSANIAYVKWDMNRIFSDVYSPFLPPERQQETAHRYILGVYALAKTLTERFPEILFEGCAAGGNRFDLGMLCFFPQIWASDDTDAAFRVQCQTNYSYGYPMSTVSAHVSACPNHQTLRTTPLETRFNVAAFGVCGYECNLCDMTGEEREEIAEQIALYKRWRPVLQYGDFYRGRCGGNRFAWTCVAKDQSAAVGLLMQLMVQPNTPFEQFFARGLAEKKKYHFYNRSLRYDVRNFGDLVNTASPVHIRPGSLAHRVVAKFVTMPGERENAVVSGGVLMRAGMKLKQAFTATGYNEEVRYFQDFSSRLYFMEEDTLPAAK